MKHFLGVLLVSTVVWCRLGFSHGDHSAPGVIPPGLHGGIVKEAVDVEEEDHDHGHGEKDHDHDSKAPAKHEEKPLFFEAAYDNKTQKVSVYPLTLASAKSAVLSPLPVAQVSISSFQVEYPRAKKTQKLAAQTTNSGFEAKIEPGSATRFFVLLEVVHSGETKRVKIQLETNK